MAQLHAVCCDLGTASCACAVLCDMMCLLGAMVGVVTASSSSSSSSVTSNCLLLLQLSTYVSFWTADTFGRRALFLQAGCQMFCALLVIAVSLKTLGGGQGVWLAWYILAMTCVYDM